MIFYDFNHIYYLSSQDQRCVYEYLIDPNMSLWKEIDQTGFTKGYYRIAHSQSWSDELKSLLDLNLITGFLTGSGRNISWALEWLEKNICLFNLFPGLTWTNLSEGTWNLVPVFMVLEEVCVIRYMVSGCMQNGRSDVLWPIWANRLLDNSTKSAIEKAAQIATELLCKMPLSSLYMYPLTIGNDKIQISGSSLGLPMAIGFLNSISGFRPEHRIAASGCLSGTEDVGKVARLLDKIKMAAQQEFKIFVYPRDNHGPHTASSMELWPISTVSSAWQISKLIDSGKAQEIVLLLKMLKNPDWFVNNIENIDPILFERAKNLDLTQKAVDAVLSSRDLFGRLCHKLEHCFRNRNLKAYRRLSDLLTVEQILSISKRFPVLSFKWCSLNLALANNCGQVERAGMWGERAKHVLETEKVADLNAIAEYFNFELIFEHNRFNFNPQLPESLQSILRTFEQQYAIQCQSLCKRDEKIGRLYGTIAQNYGFCGPGFLQKTLKYIQLAQTAFGMENDMDGSDEFKSEWGRQLNYKIYALLDAGKIRPATDVLKQYLNIKGWKDLWRVTEQLSAWQHATLARFLGVSQHKTQKAKYLQWAVASQKFPVAGEHPWQLWAYNLGKIARSMGTKDQAVIFFKNSIDLCFNRNAGKTLNLMALLPLSELWSVCALNQIEYDAIKNQLKRIALEVNENHFKLIREKKFEHVLELIHNHPECLFPFTYR